MTTLIYALSFIPMMLITLAIHELGHLAIAKLNRAKTGGFHIGMGWNIITHHTGRTYVRLTPETELLNPQTEELKPGDLASVYVTREPRDEGYTAVGLLPQNGTKLPPEQWNTVRRCNETHMRLNGKVREINEERIILADMSWSLRAIPIMAHVMLTDDPARKLPEAYNVMPWPRKAAITLAGPLANIVLMVIVLAIVAIFPITSVSTPAWTVAKVALGGPAHEAGVRPGDRIVTINNLLYPSLQEIHEQKEKAIRTGKELHIGIIRNESNLNLRVKPDPETGWIGIELEHAEVSRIEYRMTPQAAGQRMWNLGGSYFDAVTELLLTLTGDSENRLDAVSGPVMGAYQTARAVEYAGLQAWLIILATLNLGVAVTNMVPIPPLDGYRVVAEGVEALRGGRPANPKLERAMTAGGLVLIFLTGLYLLLNDITKLIG